SMRPASPSCAARRSLRERIRLHGGSMTKPGHRGNDAAGAGARAWPDLAGRLIDVDGAKAHVLAIRVYFEDTDFSGLVYHASYVRWCERGRSDFLRLLGSEHRALIEGAAPDAKWASEGATKDQPVADRQPKAPPKTEPAAFVVRRLNLEYLRPARIDD